MFDGEAEAIIAQGMLALQVAEAEGRSALSSCSALISSVCSAQAPSVLRSVGVLPVADRLSSLATPLPRGRR